MDVRFTTENGVSVPAVTTEQMREIDRVAIEETGPNLLQMMENAGRSLASVCIEMLGADWPGARIVVMAGTGGNGGGGIAAGRHLANRGVRTDVVITDADRLGEVPRLQLELLRHAGGRVAADPRNVADADLVVDAVIGYGLSSAPHGRAAELIDFVGRAAAPVVALDVPSGVDSTTGERPGLAVTATVTMTLALPKTGLHAAETGRLLLADIGIPAAVYDRVGVALEGPVFDRRWVVPLHVER